MKVYTITEAYRAERLILPCVITIPRGKMVKIAMQTTAYSPNGKILEWSSLVAYNFIVCTDMVHKAVSYFGRDDSTYLI